MKAFLVCLAIAAVGVTALPEGYSLYLQQWQQQQNSQPMQWPLKPEQPQWGLEQQWQNPQQPMPQPQPQPLPQEPQVYQYQPTMPEQPQMEQQMQWQQPQPQPQEPQMYQNQQWQPQSPPQEPQVYQYQPTMPEQPQMGQQMQWQQPQPQSQEPQMYQNQQWQPQSPPQALDPQMYSQNQQNMSPDGYKIVPGIVDSRCPRSDDPKNPTHLSIRGDCSKFMKCYGGRAYEMSCPGGLEFGASVNRCDYPTIARCSSGF